MDRKEFEGRAVIVTGAASGLGRATALAMAGAGAMVVLTDVNTAGLEETLALTGDAPANLKIFTADLTDPDAGAKLVAQTIAAFGRLDALCCVAGTTKLAKSETVTLAQWERIQAVNVRAPFFLFQAALRHLLTSEGAVVNVASTAAITGHAYLAPYAASKGGLIAMTKSLAVEYAKTPLRINVVAPGPMHTPMAIADAETLQDLDMSLLTRTMGLRPIAEPEDLTDVILYLASPRNRKVHGATFVIDQGATV